MEQERTEACTRAAFDAGINFFDTANVYGGGAAESVWGEALKDFDRGSYVLAIAGYNAGPRRVAEWIAKNRDPRIKGVDVVDWVESIPISETRNYVQRVLENVQVYRHRIGGTQIAVSIEQDLTR